MANRLAASAPEQPFRPQFTKIEKKQLERLLSRNDHSGIASFIRDLFQILENQDSPMILIRFQIKEMITIMENYERETKGFKLRNWDTRIEEILQMAKSFTELADSFIAVLAHTFE